MCASVYVCIYRYKQTYRVTSLYFSSIIKEYLLSNFLVISRIAKGKSCSFQQELEKNKLGLSSQLLHSAVPSVCLLVCGGLDF